MITGRVVQREAIVEIQAAGSSQPPQQIAAVVDTGYNGYLTLPSQAVSSFRLPFAGHRRGTLADGRVVVLDVYLANVIWHGQRMDVLISQTQGKPLIGMSLLQGSRLTIDAVDGGAVVIEELP
ncbi:MAG: clan AA aspartic protease [Planctomycetia bacterium]|nr:clan AA aspartic protease [Planctomycetia bacterium]